MMAQPLQSAVPPFSRYLSGVVGVPCGLFRCVFCGSIEGEDDLADVLGAAEDAMGGLDLADGEDGVDVGDELT